jgi:hypothetical protein
MKGDLGMCQYKTGDFERVVGWVNLCVLSFCYLQHRRLACLEQASKQERPYWLAAPPHALRAAVRRAAERADVLQLIRCARTADGRTRLTTCCKTVMTTPPTRTDAA